MKLLVACAVAAVVLCGCPSNNPPPVPPPSPPDASDAMPTPPSPVPTDACTAACANAKKLGCAVGSSDQDCVTSFNGWDHGSAHIRRKDTGNALTCADVVGATSAAQLQAMGFTCR